MRFADFTFAFPALLSAIMLTALYGPGLVISIVAIGIFNIPVFARITRASANADLGARFRARRARLRQGRASRITLEHVLPNIASILIVQATIAVRHRHPGRGGAALPRPRHAAAAAELGPHAQRGADADVPGAAAGGVPRPRHRAVGARPQPDGRRAARPARSRALAAGGDSMALLEVTDLRVTLPPRAARPRRCAASSFALERGETLGLIGEIGLRQVDDRAGADGPAARGRARHRQHPLRRPASWSACDDASCAALRGDRIGMVFQEPMTALNPLHTIGRPGRRAAAPAPRHGRARGARRGAAPARARAPARRGARASTPIRTSSRAASASA